MCGDDTVPFPQTNKQNPPPQKKTTPNTFTWGRMGVLSLASGDYIPRDPECSDASHWFLPLKGAARVLHLTLTGLLGAVEYAWAECKWKVKDNKSKPVSGILCLSRGWSPAETRSWRMSGGWWQCTLDVPASLWREEESGLGAGMMVWIGCRWELSLRSIFPTSKCRSCSIFKADFHCEVCWTGETNWGKGHWEVTISDHFINNYEKCSTWQER